MATTMFTRLKSRIRLGWGKKPHSCGQFGTKWSPSMNGGHVFPSSPSPNNTFFCLPYTSELVKHLFWDYIQVRRAWRWATFIMYELCGVRTGNYNSFNWK